MTSISFLAGAVRDQREIRCVGEENLTEREHRPYVHRSTRRRLEVSHCKMAEADDTIRIVLNSHEPMTSRTELTVVTGQRYRIEGDPRQVEQAILDAARGSIMQLAWLLEAETEQELGVNPDHVVTLRAVGD